MRQKKGQRMKLHQQIRANIKKTNEMYKARTNQHRKAHLRKEILPSRRRNNFMPRRDAPFKVLEKVNDNAYKLVVG